MQSLRGSYPSISTTPLRSPANQVSDYPMAIRNHPQNRRCGKMHRNLNLWEWESEWEKPSRQSNFTGEHGAWNRHGPLALPQPIEVSRSWVSSWMARYLNGSFGHIIDHHEGWHLAEVPGNIHHQHICLLLIWPQYTTGTHAIPFRKEQMCQISTREIERATNIILLPSLLTSSTDNLPCWYSNHQINANS